MSFKRKPGRLPQVQGMSLETGTRDHQLNEPSCYEPLESELMVGKELEDWLVADEYITRRTGQHS